MNTVPSDLTECPNCGTALHGAYCGACGQKNTAVNPTIGDFLHDLTHELLSVDGKIFSTMRFLFTRPGFLTLEYFAGRRARYASALRLYLIFSVLFFAVLAFAPDMIRVRYTPSEGEVVDAAVVEQRSELMLAAVNDVTNRWVPRLMFLLLPAFAAFIMLARRKSGRNYPQHLVFALHVHSVWFFAATVVAAVHIAAPPIPYVLGIVKIVALLYAASYFVRAFRRAYELSYRGAAWRAAAVSLAYFIVLMSALVSIWIVAALGAVGPGV